MKLKTDGIIFFLVIIALGVCSPGSAEVIDRIVAIADTDIITQIQLNSGLTPYLRQIESAGYSDEKKKEAIKGISKKVLNDLIEKSLAQQEAKKYGISVSKAQVDEAIENVKKNKSLSDETFVAALKQEGYTLEEYRENLEKQILRARLVNRTVKSKVVVSKVEIKKRYEEKKGEYIGVKKYHIRNILMNDEETINKVRQMLDENKDFIELAKTYSKAPNALDGGDLGLFEINSFPQVIKDKISQLNKGEYSDVVSTFQGFQLFYVQDIVIEGGKTQEQAYDEIHGDLYREQLDRKFKAWLKSLKEKAHIKIML